jgi:hypothetical protein
MGKMPMPRERYRRVDGVISVFPKTASAARPVEHRGASLPSLDNQNEARGPPPT